MVGRTVSVNTGVCKYQCDISALNIPGIKNLYKILELILRGG